MEYRLNHRHPGLASTLIAVTLTVAASGTQALVFEFGDDGEWQLDWDTNVAYTAQWRVAKQDDAQFDYKDLGGDDPIESLRRHTILINANDGDNNFNRSLVQSKVSFVTEMDLKWRDYGLFTRARGYYDGVYDQQTDQSQQDFLTYNSGNSPAIGGSTDFQRFPQATVNRHRDRRSQPLSCANTAAHSPRAPRTVRAAASTSGAGPG